MAITMSIARTCQQEQWKKDQASQAAYRAANETVVWIPSPMGGMMPRRDVQILEQGAAFVKFQMKDGQVIEQHGPYRIEIRKRTY